MSDNTESGRGDIPLERELDTSVISDEQSYCVFTGKPIEQVLEDIGRELALERGCECRFKDEHSNTVLICEECSKLPCHNLLSI